MAKLDASSLMEAASKAQDRAGFYFTAYAMVRCAHCLRARAAATHPSSC